MRICTAWRSVVLENWDDYRYILAVMEEGSLNAAARRLGVNHATVLRRVTAFEDRMGLTLFDRSASGYRLRGDRRVAKEALRQLEEAVAASERAVMGRGRGLSGRLRITSTDSLCAEVLPGIVSGIAARHPDLDLELISTNRHLDLGKLDAELTVRPTRALAPPLFGESAARMTFHVFATGTSPTDRWLAGTGRLEGAPPASWIAQTINPDMIVGRADSYLTLRGMILAGQGVTYLPAWLAGAVSGLQRRDDLGPALETHIWVGHHADLSGVERIDTCRELLMEGLRRAEPVLAGEA